MTFKNKIRKIVVKLGIKRYVLPVMDFINKGKTRKRMQRYDPESTVYGLNTEKRNVDIIVSFTTYPARIESARYVADVMLRQTIKPDKVLLVLADDEYPSKEALPQEYKNLEKRGLSIVFDENLKSHKKYQYAMKNFPESIVITVDDDIFYPENLIEILLNSYKVYPQAISAMRTHRMLFDGDTLLTYNDWEFESTYTDKPTFDLVATSGGGTLYPPNCFFLRWELLTDSSVIRATCLMADDIWLKVLALLCHVPVVNAFQRTPSLLTVPKSQRCSLSFKNVDECQNDTIMQSIVQYLGINVAELVRK